MPKPDHRAPRPATPGPRHGSGSVPASGTTAAPARRRNGWLVGTLLIVWWIGGYGMVVYGVTTDRGPLAFLIDAQLALFGGSNMVAGALVGALLIFHGPPLLARLLLRLWPGNRFIQGFHRTVAQAMKPRSQAIAEGKLRWATMDQAARLAALRRRRLGALIIAAILLATMAAIATYVRTTTNADVGRKLTQVVLPAGHPIELRGASDWVHVTGARPLRDHVVQRDYSIRGHRYRDFYTPLVPRGWQPGERIYLLEKDETFPDDHNPSEIANPPRPIEGRLGMGGPRHDVAAVFRRHGAPVGNWTAVLTRKQLHGRIPGDADFLDPTIWILGGIFTLMTLLVAAIAQLSLRKVGRADSPGMRRRERISP